MDKIPNDTLLPQPQQPQLRPDMRTSPLHNLDMDNEARNIANSLSMYDEQGYNVVLMDDSSRQRSSMPEQNSVLVNHQSQTPDQRNPLTFLSSIYINQQLQVRSTAPTSLSPPPTLLLPAMSTQPLQPMQFMPLAYRNPTQTSQQSARLLTRVYQPVPDTHTPSRLPWSRPVPPTVPIHYPVHAPRGNRIMSAPEYYRAHGPHTFQYSCANTRVPQQSLCPSFRNERTTPLTHDAYDTSRTSSQILPELNATQAELSSGASDLPDDHNYCTPQRRASDQRDEERLDFLPLSDEDDHLDPNIVRGAEIRPDQMFTNPSSMLTQRLHATSNHVPSTRNLLYLNEAMRNRRADGAYVLPQTEHTMLNGDFGRSVLNLTSTSITSTTNSAAGVEAHLPYDADIELSASTFRTPSPPSSTHSSSAAPTPTPTPSSTSTPNSTPTARTARSASWPLRRLPPPPLDELSLSSASEAEFVQFANTRTTNTTTTTSAAKRKNKVYTNGNSNSSSTGGGGSGSSVVGGGGAVDGSVGGGDGGTGSGSSAVGGSGSGGGEIDLQPSTSGGCSGSQQLKRYQSSPTPEPSSSANPRQRRRHNRHICHRSLAYLLRNTSYSDDDEDEEVVAWNLHKPPRNETSSEQNGEDIVDPEQAVGNGVGGGGVSFGTDNSEALTDDNPWPARRERERAEQQFRLGRSSGINGIDHDNHNNNNNNNNNDGNTLNLSRHESFSSNAATVGSSSVSSGVSQDTVPVEDGGIENGSGGDGVARGLHHLYSMRMRERANASADNTSEPHAAKVPRYDCSHTRDNTNDVYDEAATGDHEVCI